MPWPGTKRTSAAVSLTPEWNEITRLFFSSFLPLMSPADGEGFHCFPFPLFWQEAAFPLDHQLSWSKRKTEQKSRERKMETEEMRRQKNLRARHDGWLRFWARIRKGCLFMGGTLVLRVNWITIYVDSKETSYIIPSWDEREGSIV